MEEYIGKICPFCNTVIKEDDAVKVCPSCNVPHHEACWNENNGCTTFGCTGKDRETVDTVDTEAVMPEQMDAAEEQSPHRKKASKKKIIKLTCLIAGALLLAGFFTYAVVRHVIPYVKYVNACRAVEEGSYDDAYNAFIALGDFSDSADKAVDTLYRKGKKLIEDDAYLDAVKTFEKIESYKDSKELIKESNYLYAISSFDSGKYEKAVDYFRLIKEYKDVKKRLLEAIYRYALELMKLSQWEKASALFSELGDYKDSGVNYQETNYQHGLDLLNKKSYSSAVSVFLALGNYKDSKNKLNEAKYGYVCENKNNLDTTTYEYLLELKSKNYKDAKEIYAELYKWSMSNIIFNSSLEGTNSESSLSKFEPIHCHFELHGGVPGGSTFIVCKYTRPDGFTKEEVSTEAFFSNQGGSKMSRMSWDNGIYRDPAIGASGILSVEFFDEGGNFLGSASVNIV